MSGEESTAYSELQNEQTLRAFSKALEMRNKTEQLIESITNEAEIEEEKTSPVRKKAIKVGPKGTIDLQSTSTKEKQKLQKEIVGSFNKLLKMTVDEENDPLIKRFKSAVDKLQAPVEFSRRQSPG